MAKRVRSIFSSIAALAILLLVVASAAAPPAAASAGVAYLRVGHFVPGAAAVSVSVDGRTVAGSLSFQQVTSYFTVSAGTHVVALRSPSSGGAPAVTRSMTVALTSGESATVLATANATGGIVLSSFADNLAGPPLGDAKVRVIDTLSTVPTLAGSLTPVATPDDAPRAPFLVPGTPEGHASPYLDVPAGMFDVRFTNASSGATVLTGTNWPVGAATVASIVVLKGGSGPTLEVLKDAVGATTLPAGGVDTGAGGMALPRVPRQPGSTELGLTLVVALMVGAAILARRGQKPGRLAAAACVTGLVANGCANQTAQRNTTPPATVAAGLGPATSGAASSNPATIDLSRAGTADASNQPERIAVPSVGIDAPIVNLARNPDGTMQVPSDFDVAGWYDLGPAPGEPGPAVIVGHVDSYRGPAVFWHLSELRAGDLVEVTSAHGTETFEVVRVHSVAKDAFPTTEVFGPTQARELWLITCGGSFDYSTGHYLDNTVVLASLVSG
jgi:LPXTG-site transpeptidase (sortase) family protein